MLVTMKSGLSGKTHTMEIPVDEEKLDTWSYMDRGARPLIQNYFPELNADQREFLLTGITPEEWASLGDA